LQTINKLPEPWHSKFEEKKKDIRKRLEEFVQVPVSEYFYELAYCILTPATRAKNAEGAVQSLRQACFFELGSDPVEHLKNKKHCIRFHNQKSERLLRMLKSYNSILDIVMNQNLVNEEKRKLLFETVNGLGMKESSHFLRNIGVRDLAILDRHILKHLHRLGVIKEIPTSLTKKRYIEIEKKWKHYAKRVNVSIDELDLLFWSMETGEIRK
jgi:N-glycosylase/DNA lyase